MLLEVTFAALANGLVIYDRTRQVRPMSRKTASEQLFAGESS
jgi:hypothetical protein